MNVLAVFGVASWQQSTRMSPEAFAVQQRWRRRLWLVVIATLLGYAVGALVGRS